MTDWIPLQRPSEGQMKKIGGVNARVFTSPTDLPLALRVLSEPESRTLTIEFRYFLDENTESRKLSDTVDAEFGRHSGRVYKLHAHLQEGCNPEEVISTITATLKGMVAEGRDRGRNVRRENLRVTSEALEQDKDLYFADLALAMG